MIKSVIITIRIPDTNFCKDFECSTTVPFGKIMDALMLDSSNAADFKNNKHTILAEPPGVYITMSDTLEETGIWDGAILTIKKTH